MPWHYPEDLQYFKAKTLHKTVVMGRLTYESILYSLGKPLPQRHNIIITKNQDLYPGVETYTSPEAFLEVYQNRPEEIFIIGGASIYRAFIDLVDRLYITEINVEYEGDTYFPQFNAEDFCLISAETLGDLTFKVFERKVSK